MVSRTCSFLLPKTGSYSCEKAEVSPHRNKFALTVNILTDVIFLFKPQTETSRIRKIFFAVKAINAQDTMVAMYKRIKNLKNVNVKRKICTNKHDGVECLSISSVQQNDK